MTIKFLLLVNKQGQTRLAKYFTEHLSVEEKRALEAEIVRKCLARTDKQARRAASGAARAVEHAHARAHSRAPTPAPTPLRPAPPRPSLSLRSTPQCSFFEHRAYKVVYRRYASLFFMVGVDDDEARRVLPPCCRSLVFVLWRARIG
jgi:hypothetical protein